MRGISKHRQTQHKRSRRGDAIRRADAMVSIQGLTSSMWQMTSPRFRVAWMSRAMALLYQCPSGRCSLRNRDEPHGRNRPVGHGSFCMAVKSGQGDDPLAIMDADWSVLLLRNSCRLFALSSDCCSDGFSPSFSGLPFLVRLIAYHIHIFASAASFSRRPVILVCATLLQP